MSDKKDDSRTFEDAVQDRQDWIEAQFRKISRGSWARIIRMARKPTPQEFKQTSITVVLVCSFLEQSDLSYSFLWTISFLG